MTEQRSRHRRPPLTLLLLSLLLLTAGIAACTNGLNRSPDSKAKQEITACPLPRSGQPTAPPSGIYVDHDIRIDYGRLAPHQDPFKEDPSYVLHIIQTPEALEQLYFDATQGNNIAAWSACVSEVSARHSARIAARDLSSLACQTIYSCRYGFDQLPFSPDTASGARILSFIARDFQAEATRLNIRDDFLSHALSLYVGVKIASAVRPGIPASLAGTPAAAVAAGPARGFRSFPVFKRAMGPAGPGREWHHIVPQTTSNIARFGPEAIHTTSNLVRVPVKVHHRINAHYASKPIGETVIVRDKLSSQSFAAQRAYGLAVLRKEGIIP